MQIENIIMSFIFFIASIIIFLSRDIGAKWIAKQKYMTNPYDVFNMFGFLNLIKLNEYSFNRLIVVLWSILFFIGGFAWLLDSN